MGTECTEQNKDEYQNVLSEEKMYIYMHLRFSHISKLPGIYRQKNVKDSIEYRKRGNVFYKTKVHNDSIHEQTWKLYSQSIALAPNNSQELALAFGNRSALWFHLKKYEDCIKDCNRAIAISKCNFLIFKLLVRKAECLALLNIDSANNVCEEALHQISELELKCDLKSQYEDKLHNILKDIQSAKFKKEVDIKVNDECLYKFKRSKEVPCASEAVAINHTKKWGRHVIATRDIEPGEIIAIEKSYCRFLTDNGIYLYCSHCTTPAYTSIPCNHCIYGIYCSEKCKSDAWTIYHQFECPIFSSIWDINNECIHILFAIRLALKVIHESTSISKFQKMLQEIDQCTDPRIKGFSEDGMYYSDKARSFLSLMNHFDYISNLNKVSLTDKVCSYVKILATKSTFFGKKMNFSTDSEMAYNNDIVSFGALLLRIIQINNINIFELASGEGTEFKQYGVTCHVFVSLFNHSCDPNVGHIHTDKNEVILYAEKPIKQGSQLFISYISTFLEQTRKERQNYLEKVFHFKCICIACLENWSNICLPSLQEIGMITPSAALEINNIFRNCKEIIKVGYLKDAKYSPKLLQQTIETMKVLADKITVHCSEYFLFILVLTCIYANYFGNWFFNMKKECSSYEKNKSE